MVNTTISRGADWLIILLHPGDKLNQQHTPSVDQNMLARETEQLARKYNIIVSAGKLFFLNMKLAPYVVWC